MKKFILSILAVFLLASCTVAGSILLTGCSQSQSEDKNYGDSSPEEGLEEENGEESKDDITDDTDDKDLPSTEESDVISGQTTRYCYPFFGAKLVTSSDSSYAGDDVASLMIRNNDSTFTTSCAYDANGAGSTVTRSGSSVYQHTGSTVYYTTWGGEMYYYSMTLTASAVTGYSFLGWYYVSLDDDGDACYMNRESTSLSYTKTNVTYFMSDYPKPTEGYVALYTNTYTNIYRYCKSGGGDVSYSQMGTYGESFTTPSSSSFSYYDYNGWSIYGWASSATRTTITFSPGEKVTSTTYINRTSTLEWYIVFYRTIRILYDYNGSSQIMSQTQNTQYTNLYGTTYYTLGSTGIGSTTASKLTISSTVPTRTGYTFVGWALSSTATTADYAPGDMISFPYSTAATVTLYAVWSPNLVYFDYNYGGLGVNLYNEEMVDYLDSPVTESDGYWIAGTVEGNEYNNFKIQKWENGSYIDEANIASVGTVTYTFTKTVTNTSIRIGLNGTTADACVMFDVSSLENGKTYAVSARAKNSVTFGEVKIEVGSASTSYTSPSKNVTNGAAYGTLPTPTRSYYTFDGWWTAASGGTEVTSTSVAASGKIILYAHWTVNQYTVTLVAGTGIASVTGAGTYDYGTSVTISATVSEGYTFKNWKKNLSLYGNQIYTFTITSDCSYTANATANTYNLYYDYNYNSLPVNLYNPSMVSSVDSTLTQYSDSWALVDAEGNVYNGCRIERWENGVSVDTMSMTAFGTIKYTFTKTVANTSIRIGLIVTNVEGFIMVDVSNLDDGITYTVGIRVLLNLEFGGLKIEANSTTSNYTAPAKDVTYDDTYGDLPTPTRSYYTFDGWWTAASGGTQVLSTDTYTTAGNQTLYAHWTPVSITVTVNLRLISKDGTTVSISTLGGIVSVTRYVISGSSSSASTVTQTASSGSFEVHSGQLFRLAATARTGYVFAGFSTSSTPSDTIKNPTSAVTTTASYYPTTSGTAYYVYFKQVSLNTLKYDSTFKYFYFEDGEYPQTYAGTINGDETFEDEYIYFVDPTGVNSVVPVFNDENGRYAILCAPKTCTIKLTNSDGTTETVNFVAGTYYKFKFEPIRWRVSDYGVSSTEYPNGWSGYTSYNTNFTAVSDLILGYGAMNSTRSVSEGALVTSMEGFVNVQNFHNTTQTEFTYSVANTSSPNIDLPVDRYGVTVNGEGNAVYDDTTVTYTSPLRIASLDEVGGDLTAYYARASHMVAMLMGQNDTNCSYWTRDLSNLGSGVAISATGTEIRSWLDVSQGMRFAYTFSEGSRL